MASPLSEVCVRGGRQSERQSERAWMYIRVLCFHSVDVSIECDINCKEATVFKHSIHPSTIALCSSSSPPSRLDMRSLETLLNPQCM